MQRRRRRFAFTSLAMFLGCVAAFAVCEFGLRISGYPRTYPAIGLFEPDPVLGYRLVAGYSGDAWKGGRRFGIRTNGDGFRDVEDYSSVVPTSDETVRRILAVGDSFAFGLPVEADQTFLSVLERELERQGRGNSSWQVFNLGVPSYSTRQESILLERWAPRLDPDLALVVFCLDNDPYDNVHPPHAPASRAHGGIQVTREAAAATGRPLGELFFTIRVQLARFVLFEAVGVAMKSISRRMGRAEAASKRDDPIDWESTDRALEKIVSFARAIDLELLVVLIPEKDRVLDASIPDEKRVRLLRHMHERGIGVLDPTDRMRGDPVPARLFEVRGSHLSVAGNELIGRILASEISRLEKPALEGMP